MEREAVEKDAEALQAEEIAAGFLGERVRASYPIVGKGMVNRVYVVETASRKVVARMNDAAALADYRKEQWCIERAAAAGIPGPEVLAVGVAGERAYMLQSFLAGRDGVDAAGPKSDIWRQLGEYAARIHAIPVQGYGERLEDPAAGEFRSPPHPGSDGSWAGYVQYNIDSLTGRDPLLALGVLTPATSAAARGLFERLKRTAFRFGLAHGDLSLKNAMVDPSGRVAMLDWGSAEVTVVPHGDVMQLLQSRLQGGEPDREAYDAFLEGYGYREEALPDLMPLLLLRACDKLRWALDRRPELTASFAAFAKQVADLALKA
ncbi:aminoglycoside phosphotransferase family protein [Paenibacillus sp. MWE-103]|uniref:Aminoglycoside phosphotransferase family protein n=1 Tax=Paenibacillus artemisiicola TaxID=1172618 RepID=A0ABS3WGC2_9BACL|nr:aminoglycoside phosphotransferase family protein [Paenibacillus artemisiicola]MBO7747175.1 aminoglycoside phosphotransferase family protein [Paenibacillus artemisiicola]